MSEELHGKYQLTTKQVLAEIRKTDKVLDQFYKALKVLRAWEQKDKSNSQLLHNAIQDCKDIEIPGKDE